MGYGARPQTVAITLQGGALLFRIGLRAHAQTRRAVRTAPHRNAGLVVDATEKTPIDIAPKNIKPVFGPNRESGIKAGMKRSTMTGFSGWRIPLLRYAPFRLLFFRRKHFIKKLAFFQAEK